MREVTDAGPNPVDELVRDSIDVIASGIAVLDGNGSITSVNDMWRKQGPEAGYLGGATEVGDTFSEVCANGELPLLEARRFAEDVRAVISGQESVATVEYEVVGEENSHWAQSRAQ